CSHRRGGGAGRNRARTAGYCPHLAGAGDPWFVRTQACWSARTQGGRSLALRAILVLPEAAQRRPRVLHWQARLLYCQPPSPHIQRGSFTMRSPWNEPTYTASSTSIATEVPFIRALAS